MSALILRVPALAGFAVLAAAAITDDKRLIFIGIGLWLGASLAYACAALYSRT